MATTVFDDCKKDKDKKVTSSQEISQYLKDIARELKIDLSKKYNDEEIERIFSKMTDCLI